MKAKVVRKRPLKFIVKAAKMTFDEWFAEQYPNADLSESSVVEVRLRMHGAWCAALEWGTRPTSHNSKSIPCSGCEALDECQECWSEGHHPPCYKG